MPVDTLYRILNISSLTVRPLNPFVNLSLAPLSLFLTHGPDLGVWSDCWVSAEFLRAPIPRKGSGSTTTTTTQQRDQVRAELKSHDNGRRKNWRLRPMGRRKLPTSSNHIVFIDRMWLLFVIFRRHINKLPGLIERFSGKVLKTKYQNSNHITVLHNLYRLVLFYSQKYVRRYSKFILNAIVLL